MSKYKDILNQIETLKTQAARAREKEVSGVVAEIKAKMAEYGLTPTDLGFTKGRGGKSAKGKSTVAPKYRDPATGATWTGRGRAPKWVVEAEARGVKRDKFLIR